MLDSLVTSLAVVPPELAVIILSMLPIMELRGALPVALLVYHLSIPAAIFWSVIGSSIPAYILLVAFEPVAAWLQRHSPLVDRLLTAFYARTRHKLKNQVVKYGSWALILFVGIPLPATGAWTGAVAAMLFGMPRKKAFVAIFIGLFLSAVLVTILTLGASATIRAVIP